LLRKVYLVQAEDHRQDAHNTTYIQRKKERKNTQMQYNYKKRDDYIEWI